MGPRSPAPPSAPPPAQPAQTLRFARRAGAPRPPGAGLPWLGHEEPQIPPEEAGCTRPHVVRRCRRRKRGESRGPCASRAPGAPFPRSLPLLGSARSFLGFSARRAPRPRRLLLSRAGAPRWHGDPGDPPLRLLRASRDPCHAPFLRVSDLLARRSSRSFLNPVCLGCSPAPTPSRQTPGLVPLPMNVLSRPGSAGAVACVPPSPGLRAGLEVRALRPGRGLWTFCESETRSIERYRPG